MADFMIKALPVGDYKVRFNPVEGYEVKEVEEVGIINGQITDMGAVTIGEQEVSE